MGMMESPVTTFHQLSYLRLQVTRPKLITKTDQHIKSRSIDLKDSEWYFTPVVIGDEGPNNSSNLLNYVYFTIASWIVSFSRH